MSTQTELQNIKSSSGLNDLLQLVTFHIENEEFAVDILNIQGINRMVEITKVPNAPDFVEGIINLRGKVIPLICLRKRLGMPERDYDKATRFIVVEINSRVIGFIVDSVSEVLRISSSITEQTPPMVSSVDSRFITGIAKLDDRLLILLDLEKVLTYSQKDELDKLELSAN
jgi:purine-binding chemotaxis protein CheW